MKPIPAETKVLYDAILAEKAVPLSAHFYYKKRLRYYLDFCLKYHLEPQKKESRSGFIQKLKDKKQTEKQQKQAFHAVSIFHEIKNADQGKIDPLKNKKENSSTKKPYVTQANADWREVYENLDSEIKLRHYSPKTLEAYRGWVRQLQGFSRSKDPQLLSSADAKDFLTFLAVKRKVSASSQNQAFNALLFFYRQILKNEFGELKDVVRAKRRSYIPVVL